MECRKSSLKFVILRNERYKPFKYTLPNIVGIEYNKFLNVETNLCIIKTY